MEVLIIIGFFILVASFNKKNEKNTSSNPIIGFGRSPYYYDIMDEAYADYEEKLKTDAENNVFYTRTTLKFNEWKAGKKGISEQISAKDVYQDFLKWKNNGYM